MLCIIFHRDHGQARSPFRGSGQRRQQQQRQQRDCDAGRRQRHHHQKSSVLAQEAAVGRLGEFEADPDANLD